MEEFRSSIFEKTKEKSRKRLVRNFVLVGSISGMWVLFFIGFPFIGLKTAIGFSIVLLGWKLYNDKYMGISAYGERKDNLVITEQYLEIRDVKLFYSELTNLVIYVDEYLGMPKEFFGIYHGGDNKIEFDHNGRTVSISYVIKNKQDFQRVGILVDRIEKNPSLHKNLRKL
jgi:hypothetical protein